MSVAKSCFQIKVSQLWNILEIPFLVPACFLPLYDSEIPALLASKNGCVELETYTVEIPSISYWQGLCLKDLQKMFSRSTQGQVVTRHRCPSQMEVVEFPE